MKEKSSVTIATLNLWGSNDWHTRAPRIAALISEVSADVICTQEMERDPARGDFDQLQELQQKTAYPYASFWKARLKTTSKGMPLEMPVEHGLGVLSKYPIEDVHIVPLQKADARDTEDRISVFFSITKNGRKYDFVNVHFSNSDDWARNHLAQVVQYCIVHSLSPIMLGDFNIFSLSKEQHLLPENYTNSFDVQKYISYPDDVDTLDYIMIPQPLSFVSIACREEEVSDHKMLCAEIH